MYLDPKVSHKQMMEFSGIGGLSAAAKPGAGKRTTESENWRRFHRKLRFALLCLFYSG
ncbi:hypothetical protein GUJ93_ZPchr0006g46059 [Zizania palustris]|uniref:Uncharacterized protein n=1 Tax=Zizania palustris TaxID=103762 RepID=A0A8J5VT87_ZIZPA|nr:hypothetical protein GUJ93_ZPchr0006g46059 [Zizania palustris]